jgi:DivIVA domain-containing protein
MELTLKRLLEHAEFKKYRGKGYDPTEVDDFLDKAVAMAGKVEVQLTQALEQAKAGGAASGPSAEEVEAEVERRVAERLAAQPAAPTGPSEEETAEQVRRTIVMAQRTADAAVAEAREDAEKIVSAAREQAEGLVTEAQAHADAQRTETDAYVATTRREVADEAARERREARQRLATEIAELEGVRESLRADVNILERHVEEQRSQLGSTLAELQQILDDPSGFRMAPVPALAEPDLPDFSDLAEPAPSAVADPVAAGDAPDDAAAVAAVPEAPAGPDASAGAEAPAAEEPSGAADAAPEAPATPATPATSATPVGAADELPSEAAKSAPVLSFGEIDHAAPGLERPLDPIDAGPPTAPVTAVELGVEPAAEDDAFLAELRKAMADDEPLGPRDHQDAPEGDTLFGDEDRRGWRFGRRN